jgi:hypothetical protein
LRWYSGMKLTQLRFYFDSWRPQIPLNGINGRISDYTIFGNIPLTEANTVSRKLLQNSARSSTGLQA